MRRLLARGLPWLTVASIALGAWWLWPAGDTRTPRLLDPAALAAALPADADDGFARFIDTWTPELPRDLGPHPEARAEVWDLTGSLHGDDGARYGLRLTLVRLGLRAPTAAPRASALAADALLLGRLALVPAGGQPLRAERASRVAGGLAGAGSMPPEVWLEDWHLVLGGPFAAAGAGDPGRLRATLDGVQLDLSLTAEKAVVSPAANLLDGGAAGNAGGDTSPGFRWLAEPRLSVSGRLVGPSGEQLLSGSAWLDRVWGSADGAAGAGLAGTRGQLALNRFLLQLDDGTELLCIHLRRRAGGGTPVPTCLDIAADGSTRVLRRRDLTLTPGVAAWRSPNGDATYPIEWHLAAPQRGLELDIQALHPSEELMLGEPLWSGAVVVSGERDGQRIDGGGRMDLSGYRAAAGG